MNTSKAQVTPQLTVQYALEDGSMKRLGDMSADDLLSASRAASARAADARLAEHGAKVWKSAGQEA